MKPGRLLLLRLFLLLPPFAALGEQGADGVLRSAAALDALLMSGRDEVRPFALTGQVLLPCRPDRKIFFLSDGTNIVRLVDKALWPRLVLREGDRIAVTGTTARLCDGGINPDCLSIVRLGPGRMPEPASASVRDILHARGKPLRHVRVQGRVRDVFRDDIDHEYCGITLTDDTDSLMLSLKCGDSQMPGLRALVGAEVSVDGVIRTDESFDPLRKGVGSRVIREPTLTIAHAGVFRVLSPASRDPFDAPPLAGLNPTWPADLATAPRCRVHGRVLSAARPRGFLLEAPDGRLVNVDLADSRRPQAGDGVTAVGLPFTDHYRINLARAIWKPDGPCASPVREEPARTSVRHLLTDGDGHAQYRIGLFGKAISLTGVVRSLPAPGGVERRILLEDGGHVLPLVAEPHVDPFAGLALGMAVEVRGVCLVDVEPWRPGMVVPRVTDVCLAVQSPDDVRVLARPSWWTPGRLLVFVCFLALTTLAGLVGNVILRAVVRRRSRELLREQAHRLTETLRVGERTRLAAELHDTVAQALSGLSLQIDAAGRLACEDPIAAKSVLALTSKALLACRRELRDCLWDLRSRALDEKSMDAAVRRTLAPHLGSARLDVRFCVSRRKVADQTAHAVLRVLGELACNALRHGKAKTIRIAGSLDGEGLKFSCTDDGCGFDVRTAPGSSEGHFGLQGIRDRIRAFGGRLTIVSTPGKGTRAVVILHQPHAEAP